jgi:Tol biopolymer transport system component
VLRRDGEVIMWTNPDPGHSGDLVAQDPETAEVRTLVAAEWMSAYVSAVNPPLIGRAAWSADGRWAAFEVMGCSGGEGHESAGGIWVTDGQDEPRRVTNSCFEDVFETVWEWSATGAQLAVARRSIDGDALVLIDPATGNRTELGKAAGVVTSLAWSPDGTRIAYGTVPTVDEYSGGAVYSVAVNGGDHTLLASSLGRVSGGETGSGLRWSPDGAHIAVLTEAEETSLYLLAADGSDIELLTEGVVIEHGMGAPGLVWSADGTRMAYATISGGRRGELRIWNGSPDGSTPVLLFDSAPSQVGYSVAGGPVWSPDGRQIAFRYADAWLLVNADAIGQARPIEELRYLSWRGGWYFCECYG